MKLSIPHTENLQISHNHWGAVTKIQL